MDTYNPTALIRALLPKVPLMVSTTLAHALSLSPTSASWDLRTALVIHVLRSFLTTKHPQSVSKSQKMSLRDPGIKGPMWISKFTFPRPTDADSDMTAQLTRAFNLLKDEAPGLEAASLPDTLDTVDVEAEWTGYRPDVGANAPQPDISEGEKYERLMSEVKSDSTVLYFHGGAYYLLDPCSHRLTTARLARLTSGRVCSVRYRLAPQHPFPCALLDALTAYLSLLYPPPSSPHAPIPASHIVLAGDSAGGGLALALLQLLLALHRHAPNPTIRFGGEARPLPLPRAAALNSPWLDLTHALPSVQHNAQYDYLPPITHAAFPFPPCPLWPASPPRRDLYTVQDNLLHPLVSPVLAPTWAGCPPLYVQCGEELLMDESLCLGRYANADGVGVVLDLFERMPHCFALVMPEAEFAADAFRRWAAFITTVVEGGEVASRGCRIEAKTLRESEMQLADGGMEREEVRERMLEVVRKREVGDGGRLVPKL